MQEQYGVPGVIWSRGKFGAICTQQGLGGHTLAGMMWGFFDMVHRDVRQVCGELQIKSASIWVLSPHARTPVTVPRLNTSYVNIGFIGLDAGREIAIAVSESQRPIWPFMPLARSSYQDISRGPSWGGGPKLL
jgi:hypothetical protein